MRGGSIILHTLKILKNYSIWTIYWSASKKIVIINKKKWQWGRFEWNFGIDYYYKQRKKECYLFSFYSNVILIHICVNIYIYIYIYIYLCSLYANLLLDFWGKITNHYITDNDSFNLMFALWKLVFMVGTACALFACFVKSIMLLLSC